MDTILREQYLPFLEKAGKITQEENKKFVKEAELKKESLEIALMRSGYVTAADIEAFFREEIKMPVVDLQSMTIPEAVIERVDKQLAKKYAIMPFKYEGNTLSIAIKNPRDIVIVDDLRAVLGLSIQTYFSLPIKIKEAYKKYYEGDVAEDKDVNIDDIMAEVESEEFEVVEGEEAEGINDLMHAAEETPVIKVTNFILTEGIRRRASDIFVEPWEKHMAVRCRVDGLLEGMKAPPLSMASSIASRIKVMSNLDIAERRMPQDGRFKIKYKNRFVEFRVSVLPSSFGEKVCMRILDKKSQTQKIESLGFADHELVRIKDAATKPNGMILVTGPTGSGKTSTLYSILDFIDLPEKNITTVEDPVEYQIYGINQVNIREQVGLTFSAALRSILRQDPDIIMVGEIRDFITMDIAIKAALTGHLVLSTLHTNDACGSIIRITNMGIEPFLVASSVLMVSAQRLLRKLCSECKMSFSPNEKLVKDLGLQPEKGRVFYQAQGCEQCRDTGYMGRTVITEVLPITVAIRELIMKRETGGALKEVGRGEGMTTLRESGIYKVCAGETTVDEVLRVTAADSV